MWSNRSILEARKICAFPIWENILSVSLKFNEMHKLLDHGF